MAPCGPLCELCKQRLSHTMTHNTSMIYCCCSKSDSVTVYCCTHFLFHSQLAWVITHQNSIDHRETAQWSLCSLSQEAFSGASTRLMQKKKINETTNSWLRKLRKEISAPCDITEFSTHFLIGYGKESTEGGEGWTCCTVGESADSRETRVIVRRR